MNSRTIYFLPLLFVVLSNLLFAPGWQSGPFATMLESKAGMRIVPATLANTDGPTAVLKGKAVAMPNTSGMNDKTETPVGLTRLETEPIGDANTPVAKATSRPRCDIGVCSSTYRSFRESDCTYQPSGGPRRLCMKGVVPTDPSGAPDAAAITTNADADPRPNHLIQHRGEYRRPRTIKLFGLTLPAIR
jgi:BA14K-like protein